MRNSSHQLYAWLPMLIILLAIGAVSIGFLALEYVKNRLIATTGESLALAASDIADMLDRLLFERYNDVPMMARARVFQERDPAAMSEYLEWMKAHFSVYRWLGVTDAAGRIIAATNPASVGKDISRSYLFQTVRDRGEVHIQDVEVSADAGGIPVVAFAGPIVNREKKFLGVVISNVALHSLEDVSTAAIRTFQLQRGESGKIEYQFITRDGDVIVDSILRQEMQVNLKRLALPSALLSASAQPGYIEEMHLRRKIPVVTGYAQAEGSGFGEFVSLHWGVLVRMDQKDILAPIRAVQWNLGVTGALMLLPLVGFLLWTTRRLQKEWAAAQEESRRAVAAEATMRESEERYRLVTETATDAILTIDDKSRIVFVNRAVEKIFGHTRLEILGQPLTMLMPARLRPVHEASIKRYLGTGKKHIAWEAVELTGLHKNGTEIPLEVSFSEFIKDEQHLFTGIVRDITERKHAQEALRQSEEQLRQSQKMEAIGKLAGGIAHDFNNLLTAIQGYSELLLGHLQPEQKEWKNVQQIRWAAALAASLTHQLLAFSRRQVLTPKVLNLNAVATNLEPMLRRLIGEDIELGIAPGPALGQVLADPGQIEQIILNLVVNARDAMPQGGKLTIETANVELDKTYASQHLPIQPGSYVMLAVSDTGCGMDAATQARIFEPFFTTKEQGKGTGLGLPTVYGVVKQSGGNIWVYSEPGCGTTFKIYLPRIEGASEEVEPGLVSSKSFVGTETIMLVEDHESVRELVKNVLEEHGYTVLVARHSEEAFKINGRHKDPIHLLLTDVVMPKMSGRELAERLRSSRPHMRVLYMSGYTDDTVVHHGVLAEGTVFLQKPFTPNALLQKVHEVLGAPATEKLIS